MTPHPQITVADLDASGRYPGSLYLSHHDGPLPGELTRVAGNLYIVGYAHPLPDGLISVSGTLHLNGYAHRLPDGLMRVGGDLSLGDYRLPLPAALAARDTREPAEIDCAAPDRPPPVERPAETPAADRPRDSVEAAERREAEEARMRLRDTFAAAALTGMLAANIGIRPEVAAGFAYAVADAMLAARDGAGRPPEKAAT